jgi:hypothetical protein
VNHLNKNRISLLHHPLPPISNFHVWRKVRMVSIRIELVKLFTQKKKKTIK